MKTTLRLHRDWLQVLAVYHVLASHLLNSMECLKHTLVSIASSLDLALAVLAVLYMEDLFNGTEVSIIFQS